MNKQLLSDDTEKDKTIISEDEITKIISESLLDLGFRPNLKASHTSERLFTTT